MTNQIPHTPDSSPTSQRSHAEPLAIIGMGCRFPGGAHSPAAFWELLSQGKDGVIETPPERWSLGRFCDPDPSRPGKMPVRQGGFLQEPIDGFDPLFFGISPRDAQAMDPQQRLLLEVVWEACEDAGLDMDQMNGSNTGVYIGGFMQDFTAIILSPLNRPLLNNSSAIGVNLAMLANRISHAFNLLGPSIAMDTACSSSLVSFHQACQSVWNGECSMAISGGVNLMIRPEYNIALHKGQFLAPDGRSKSFDARGNGYGRGEGAGIVVIKPLSAAQRDNDRIYALVHATGANQDGHTNGITVPSGPAQQALIRKVCAAADIDPQKIRYIEAHGTGTPLGDPTECKALGSVYGLGRPEDQPCMVGSVKANIGHLEAAAGIAGVIKAVLCLHHQQIPPQANLETLNPNIPFEALRLRVSQALHPMPAGDGPALVGVNSFGYGGTNAHAILSEAPEAPLSPPVATDSREQLIPLSARCEAGLKALAKRWLDWLEDSQPLPTLPPLGRAAGVRRTHHDRRLALVANSTTGLIEQLRALTAPDALLPAPSRISSQQAQRPVFVLTGMGPQWWAMGRQLLAEEPIFRQTATTIDAHFQKVAGWSILEEMQRPEAESRIAETRFAQPGNFVVQVGLVTLLRAWGVEPAAVVGHSLGEVSAAYITGALSFEDAILVSYHRSRLQQKAVGAGRMLAVGLPPEECPPLLAPHGGKVVIAAINSPTSSNLAGDADALAIIAQQLEARGVFNRFLRVDIPYHSPAMDPLKPELRASLVHIQPRVPTLPLYSTVTGLPVQGADWGAEYWVQNLREPVLFAAAMGRLIQDGYGLFVEIGPHPVLATSMQECLSHKGVTGETLATLNRTKPERATLLETVGKLYTHGYPVAWERIYPAELEQHLTLPTYPWQRERYWPESDAALMDRLYTVEHTLLGQKINAPLPTWESQLNPALVPFLNDHRVEESVVFPGAGYVELGLAIHRLVVQDEPCLLERLQFHQALVITGGEATLRMSFDPKSHQYTVHSQRADQPDHWTLHASGILSPEPLGDATHLEMNTVQRACTESMEIDAIYAQLDATGLHYGPWFRGIRQIKRGENAVLVQVAAHPEWSRADDAHRLHPTLLDTCFQALMITMKPDDGLYLPVGIQRLRFYATPAAPFWCHIQITDHNARFIECDLTLCDSEGRIYAELEKLRCKAVPKGQNDDEGAALNDWLYRLSWEPVERPTATTASAPKNDSLPLVILDHDTPLGESLAKQLIAAGAGRVERMSHPLAGLDAALASLGPCRAVIALWGATTQPTPEDPIGMNPTIDTLGLIQTLVRMGENGNTPASGLPRLYLVTQGAQPAHQPETLAGLHLAPLVGLARVAANEQPGLRCTVLDLDPHDPAACLADLATEVLADLAESEVAWRDGQRLVNRLVRAEAATLAQQQLEPSDDPAARTPFVLEAGRPGAISSLQLRACERRPPGPGEVEIEVHAAGIGARDVTRITQRDPEGTLGKTFFGDGIGMEVSGVVTRVGPGVQAPAKDEAVLAILPGGFRSHITLPVNAIWTLPRPRRIGDAECGGLPMAFLAAYFGLYRAYLGTGEKVLIHSAHCGMGLAAIQVAQWRGAELFVTADTPEKRKFLRSLGLRHVFDSRFPTYVEQIMAATGERGVDVIFNTLGGEAGQKSVLALAPFGRFVELGEYAARKDAAWNLASVERNLSFMSVDLDHLARRREIMPFLLEEISAQFANGTFKPIQTHVFPADRAAEAFEHVQSGQLGKAVLDMRGTGPMTILPQRQEPPLFDADGTYLITGGFGSFGLELAAWMGRQGVRQLVLTGRQGAASPEAKQAVMALESTGVRVMAVAMDVTSSTEVTRLIQRIGHTMPPLRGIVHAAAVLDDGLLMDLDPDRMRRVLAPKALGAWHLHQATQSLKLDFFALFSSVSSLIGNAGQGNYVAANAFLDALAHARRAAGLPATSINWGALGEVGMAARDKEVERRLQRGGIHSIGITQAMTAFARVLRWNPSQLGVLHMDWEAFAQTNPLVTRIPRYSGLVASDDNPSSHKNTSQLRQQLATSPENLRRGILVDHIRALVAKVLGIPNLERVLPHVQLFDLGIDSLTAVELKNKLEAEVGLSLGSSLVFNYPTIDALANFLASSLFADTQTATPDTQAAATPAPDQAAVAKLSDDEAEALLLEELMNTMSQLS
ncbi:MAG: type I polyketide synthase [Magnetococcales bacterium]|nr:type I polyketide synthase [Magnetococcales bacterium]